MSQSLWIGFDNHGNRIRWRLILSELAPRRCWSSPWSWRAILQPADWWYSKRRLLSEPSKVIAVSNHRVKNYKKLAKCPQSYQVDYYDMNWADLRSLWPPSSSHNPYRVAGARWGQQLSQIHEACQKTRQGHAMAIRSLQSHVPVDTILASRFHYTNTT